MARTTANFRSGFKNGNFESYPAFTAATNVAYRGIDGQAAGQTSATPWGWNTNPIVGTCSTQFDTDTYYSGACSLKVSTLATDSYIYASSLYRPSSGVTLALLSATAIRVLPDTGYVFSCMMKTVANSGSAQGANVQIYEYGVDAALKANFSITSNVATTTDWTFYSKTFTTNVATAFVFFMPYVLGNGGTGTLIMDAWFDDVKFTKSTRTASLARSAAAERGPVA